MNDPIHVFVPQYKRIAAVLRDELARDLNPGDRLAGEVHLARRFKVNPRTMRQALQILVDEGRIERHRPQGTIVAQPRTDKWVAILMDHDIGHPHLSYFMRRALQDLRRYFQSAGIKARPYLGFRQFGTQEEACTCEEFVDDLNAGRFSGVIVHSGRLPESLYRALTETNVPFVGHNQPAAYLPQACRVSTNLTDLVRQGLGYLAANGRRRVAMIAYSDRHHPEAFGESCHNVFRHEAAMLDMEARDAWIRDDFHPMLPGAGWDEFREIWSARDRPDGLLVTDDVLFQDVVHALRELKIRIPEQLMVVAHANRGSDLRAPFPVAWLEIDPAEYARKTGELLLKLTHGIPIEIRHVALSCRLITPENNGTERPKRSKIAEASSAFAMRCHKGQETFSQLEDKP